jgi:hypothetical protein
MSASTTRTIRADRLRVGLRFRLPDDPVTVYECHARQAFPNGRVIIDIGTGPWEFIDIPRDWAITIVPTHS